MFLAFHDSIQLCLDCASPVPQSGKAFYRTAMVTYMSDNSDVALSHPNSNMCRIACGLREMHLMETAHRLQELLWTFCTVRIENLASIEGQPAVGARMVGKRAPCGQKKPYTKYFVHLPPSQCTVSQAKVN